MSTLQERCFKALVEAKVPLERDPDGALRVRARSSQVGDLVVAFDDEEITVFIGDFTHCHFTPGAEGDVNAIDKVGEAVREAVRFILGVLNDRWVIWAYPNGAGGCYEIGEENSRMADAPLPGSEVRSFLWSGRNPSDGAA